MTGRKPAMGDDPFGYKGARVAVVGCATGIGHAAAQLLAEAGAEVHGLDIRSCDLSFASFTSVDLRDVEGLDAAAAALPDGIDAIFNCAGIPPGGLPLDVMMVNFLGIRHLTDRLVPKLALGGAIANVASNGGMAWANHLGDLRELLATPGFAEGLRWCEDKPELVGEGYRFSKEALIVWTMREACTLIRKGLRVNCTQPGAVQTPMLAEIEKTTPAALIDAVTEPFGRRSTAEEQAMVLLFLNSEAAAYINGAVLPVDGGFIASLALRR